MNNIEDYNVEKNCIYKDEHYSARDNGAIMRHQREGMRVRKDDNVWTFGKKNDKTGYMDFAGQSVHRIVAFAFLGNPPTNLHVVDHIDTNRRNNRPENLRWVTRLENVLNNPITRARIENICGSIEAFLANPSILRGHERIDPNFSWMRAVSPEEARASLERLTTWAKEHPQPQGGSLGEWVYTESHIGVLNRGYNAFSPEEEIKEVKNPIVNTIQKNEIIPDNRDNQMLKYRQQNERKKEKNKINSEIISIVEELAKKHGWEFHKDVKGDSWNADIVLINDNNKIAFKLFRRTKKMGEENEAMKKDEIKCCWFVNDNPQFNLYNHDGGLNTIFHVEIEPQYKVRVNELYDCSIEEFVAAVMNNKLHVMHEVTVKSIAVRFKKLECYNCDAEHYIYIISKLYCEKGEIINDGDGYYREELDELNPLVINSIKSFLNKHPELQYKMGEIKERHSNTMDESYMSFGCPNCDAIFGQYYLSEEKIYDAYNYGTEDLYRMGDC